MGRGAGIGFGRGRGRGYGYGRGIGAGRGDFSGYCCVKFIFFGFNVIFWVSIVTRYKYSQGTKRSLSHYFRCIIQLEN